jgi:hypothetical protein
LSRHRSALWLVRQVATPLESRVRGIMRTIASVVLLAIRAAVLMIGDNVVLPALIGEAAALPFLLVLIGMLGGLPSARPDVADQRALGSSLHVVASSWPGMACPEHREVPATPAGCHPLSCEACHHRVGVAVQIQTYDSLPTLTGD